MLNTLSPREREAVAYYDKEARRDNAEEMPIWADDFMQLIFFDLPENGEVIDVGCGRGRAIPVLEQLGVRNYLGIDPSVDSVEYCRRNFPRHQFDVDEIRTIGQNYPERFGGFFIGAVLMHIPREDIGLVISSLRRCLKEDARGFFSLPMGQDGVLEVRNRYDMDLTLFTVDEVTEVFSGNGFNLLQLETDGHMLKGHAVAI